MDNEKELRTLNDFNKIPSTIYKLFKEDKKLAVAFAVGLSSINTIFMTRSLEFLPVMFVLMIAILLVLKARKNGGKNLGVVFLVMGVLTCYLDFLTCETIVLSVPLIVYAYLNIKEGKTALWQSVFYYRYSMLDTSMYIIYQKKVVKR